MADSQSPSPENGPSSLDNGEEKASPKAKAGSDLPGVPKKQPPPEKVKVIVRCRPISKKELDQGHVSVVQVNLKKNEIEVHRHNPSSTNLANAKRNKIFTFDNVYDDSASQRILYEEVFRSLVDSVLDGFNGTIFAYGQTGTGKTYTMEGIRDSEEFQGVIPNAFKHVFTKITESPPSQTYLVRASYLEIYQEEIRDLLYRDKVKTCELKESNGVIYVKDLSTNICRNFGEINDLMSRGNKNRSVGATNMNEHSSRSHAIFMITIEMSEKWADGSTHIRVGKLNLVDLAGSERQGKTGSEGDRLKEAVKINLSLSALGHVIGALAEGNHKHIPYRDSKLTRLLQDSLGGNSRTIMVATVGPASFNYDETMVTLRYASRAKKIKNKPKVNEDPKDTMLKMYQDEIAKLKAQLEAKKYQQLGPDSPAPDPVPETRPRDRPKSRRVASEENSTHFNKKLMKELTPYLSSFGLEHISDPKEILRLLEEKRRALLLDNETVKEEKERLVKKLESTQKRVRAAEEECSQLHSRIEWLESKVINGGKSLLDHTNEQQKQIEFHQRELEQEKRREEEIRQKIAEQDLSVAELREMVNRLEGEFAHKTKKLGKIKAKIVKQREAKVKRNEDFAKEMAELKENHTALEREVKVSETIMDNFVPPKVRIMLEGLLRHNKADETFSMLPMSSFTFPRPPVDRQLKGPLYTKSLTKRSYNAPDLFYTDENIVQLHFDGPKASTLLYVPPKMDPYIKAMLVSGFEEAETELSIDCTRFSTKRKRTATARIRLGEILSLKNGPRVRQILSSKHRSKGIPFKDFVLVAPTMRRAHSGLSDASTSSNQSITSRKPSTRSPSSFHPYESGDGRALAIMEKYMGPSPEEYLRVPPADCLRDMFGDQWNASLDRAQFQKQLYLDSCPTRPLSPRDLQKALAVRNQNLDPRPKTSRPLSQLLTSADRAQTARGHNQGQHGNMTYRVQHPKTTQLRSMRDMRRSPESNPEELPLLDPIKSRANHYPGTVRAPANRSSGYSNLNPPSSSRPNTRSNTFNL